jgi:hypothetical protein
VTAPVWHYLIKCALITVCPLIFLNKRGIFKYISPTLIHFDRENANRQKEWFSKINRILSLIDMLISHR